MAGSEFGLGVGWRLVLTSTGVPERPLGNPPVVVQMKIFMVSMQGQVLGITSSSAANVAAALRAVMNQTGHQPEGFYILVPVRGTLQLQGNDGHRLLQLEGQ